MLKQMLIALCVIAVPAAAQVAPSPFEERKLDPAQMAAMMANSQRSAKPASFVLDHKAELALTPEQVKQLDLLVHGEEDSAIVRQIRMTAAMTRLMKKREESSTGPQIGWVGVINEKQLRDEACEQSAMQVEFMISLLRDRQAVGNILTGTQIDKVQQLEMSEIVRALKLKQP